MESQNEIRLAGTVVESIIEDTKTGKQILKMVVETDPPAWMKNATAKDRVQVIVFGRTIDEAKKLAAGDSVGILGRMRGREYNGKWYTDVIGEQFKRLSPAKHREESAPATDDLDGSGIPF